MKITRIKDKAAGAATDVECRCPGEAKGLSQGQHHLKTRFSPRKRKVLIFHYDQTYPVGPMKAFVYADHVAQAKKAVLLHSQLELTWTLFALSGTVTLRNTDVSTPPEAIVKGLTESGWSSLPIIGERPI